MLLARRSIAHNNARIPLVLLVSLTDICFLMCGQNNGDPAPMCGCCDRVINCKKEKKKVYRHPFFVLNLINGTLNGVFR